MADLPWGSEQSFAFITNVGLITSSGPNGQNIMAAEWTHQISYEPGMVAICIGDESATAENIRKTKEFGISISSIDQNVLVSVAGGASGKNTDKIKVLEELGFKFHKAKKIKALMVDGAVLNVECKLINEMPLGDHIMFVGEALEASVNKNKEPLALHKGMYWKMTETIQKPSPEARGNIKKIIEKFSK